VAHRTIKHRRIKIHRSYTVEELADTLGVHKNTVRSWIKSGLSPTDDRRPSILRGVDVATFLNSRRQASKRPCGPGEMYCFKCRTAKTPDGLMADLEVVLLASARPAPPCSTGRPIPPESISFAENWRSQSGSPNHA
jgi:DNA-binding XRE family transcriptional regulator